MKNLFFHTKLILLITFLAFSSIAMAQDKEISREKGDYTFTAASTADAIIWNIDGVEQTNQTGLTFSKNWQAGTFMLSALPSNGGCVGNIYNLKLIIKPDVTKGDTQIVITSPSTILPCPYSNMDPSSGKTLVELEFRAYNDTLNPGNYTLIDGVNFAVKYSFNGVVASAAFDGENAKSKVTVVIDTKNYVAGNYPFEIMMLVFGKTVMNKQVDYRNAANPPKISIIIKDKFKLENLKVVE